MVNIMNDNTVYVVNLDSLATEKVHVITAGNDFDTMVEHTKKFIAQNPKVAETTFQIWVDVFIDGLKDAEQRRIIFYRREFTV